MRAGLRVWVGLWGAAATGCVPHLIGQVPRTVPFHLPVPGGETLPAGTWGLVVARDTLWAGELRVETSAVGVDTFVLPVGDVRCLAYRLPPSYRPTGIYGESRVAAGAWAAMGIVNLGLFPVWWNLWGDWAPITLFLFPSPLHGFLVSVAMVGSALSYPRRVLQRPYTFALTDPRKPSPEWAERCAEVLHFYRPLLEQRAVRVIPLR